jgi:Fe-S-cluster containining protein
MIAPATSPCSTCTEGCCHEYLVTVTGLDVYRITRGLSLAPAQFTVAVPIVKPGVEGFRLGAADDRFQLALDKQRGAPRAGWCVFWLPFGETAGRCGIYQHRPQVCQTYPATMVDGEVARRDDVLCPAGSWGPESELLGEAWRRRAERQFAEYEIDAIVNRRWNTSGAVPEGTGDALDAYATWMLAVYAELDGHPAAPLEWTNPDRSVLDALEAVLDAHPPAAATVP